MEQTDLLKLMTSILDDLDIPFMVVGSYASGAYGEPRFTHDIDIVINLSLDQLSPLTARLPSEDFYFSTEAATDAIISGGQFNVIHPESGIKIDLMIPGSNDWERQQMTRRLNLELLEGFTTFAGAPEDIIISKMRYYREGGSEKHLRDITGMLKISGDRIDRDYIAMWAGKLDLMDIWQAILKRIGTK